MVPPSAGLRNLFQVNTSEWAKFSYPDDGGKFFSKTSQHICYNNPEDTAWATAAVKTCKRSSIFLLPSTKSPSFCVKPSAQVSQMCAFHNHDSCCYVSRRILTPPLFRLQTQADLRAHVFAQFSYMWHQPMFANLPAPEGRVFVELILLRISCNLPIEYDLSYSYYTYFDPEDGEAHSSEATKLLSLTNKLRGWTWM